MDNLDELSRSGVVSLHMAILKVLSSYPDGLATAAALKADLAILSGSADWTTRMRKLAARMPHLDVFSQKFVVRDGSGWRITAAGRAMLDRLEDRHAVFVDAGGEAELVAASARGEPDESQIEVLSDMQFGARPQLKVIQGGKTRSHDQIKLAMAANIYAAMRP
jgi:hypothetical protein